MKRLPSEALKDLLVGQGAPSSGVLLLDRPTPKEHLRFVDLLPAEIRQVGSTKYHPVYPDAVVEFQRRPVFYAVDAQKVADRSSLFRMRCALTMRGDAGQLVVARPGRLTVYPLGLKITDADQEQLLDTPDALTTLCYNPPKPSDGKPLDIRLRDLLLQTTHQLVKYAIAPDDALSLVGRAFLMRFLLDRGIIAATPDDLRVRNSGDLRMCMASAEDAAATSGWLDHTFNGHLLPLSGDSDIAWFRRIEKKSGKEVFSRLSDVLSKSDPGGQLHFSWDTLDFGHIPVGLLSQIYEDFARTYDPDKAHAESVHYTPRNIAEYVVDEAFSDLPDAHRARVLDPAAGAGVFLVAAYRRLIAARWEHDGKRPDSRTLRDILYKQIVGFDISEPALRLCALSLYLTALELDPAPTLGAAIRFEDLRSKVLYDVRSPAERDSWPYAFPPLGSLGPHVMSAHHSQYDVVLGNPPWTSWDPDPQNDEDDVRRQAQRRKVERLLTAVLRQRLPDETDPKFEMGDYDPDLAFFARALRWARPGGRIALALHSRILFKRADLRLRMRRWLFRAARVTGVVNGSALANTPVWPGVNVEFSLIFARNESSQQRDAFYYISLLPEEGLNRRGNFRIDYGSAQPIDRSILEQRPELLKTLFRGSSLDAAVLRHLGEKARPLNIYWEQDLHLKTGQGFKVGGTRSLTVPVKGSGKRSMAQSAKDGASSLSHLPQLSISLPAECYSLCVDDLPLFSLKAITRARKDLDIYRGPLVLVRESLNPGKSRAILALKDVAYNRSYMGYSCHGHPDAEMLARYMLLVLNSSYFLFEPLLTSSRFGVDRRIVTPEDLKSFPFLPLDTLTKAQRLRVSALSKALCEKGSEVLGQVDKFVAEIYGLDSAEMEVISDTLDVSLPFAENRKRAEARPTEAEAESFAKRISKILSGFGHYSGQKVSFRIAKYGSRESWVFFQLDSHAPAVSLPPLRPIRLGSLLEDADETGASLIVTVDQPGSMTIGLLAQYRYFTPTRARILALDLTNEHEKDVYGDRASA